jgi:hypothetical protein
MTILEQPNLILLEEESVIQSVVVTDEAIAKLIEKFMQDEAFYGDPDFSYY